MEDVGREKILHNFISELVVQEFNDDLDVRRHEDVLILLLQKLFQEDQPILGVHDPVRLHTLHLDRVGQTAFLAVLLPHLIVKEILVDVRTFGGCGHDNLLVRQLLKLESLLVDHLDGLEGALDQVLLETLVIDKQFEDILDVIDSRVWNFGHVVEQDIDDPVVIRFKSEVEWDFVFAIHLSLVVKGLQQIWV